MDARRVSTIRCLCDDRTVMANSGTKFSGRSKASRSRLRAGSTERDAGSSPRVERPARSGVISTVSRDNPVRGRTDWTALKDQSDDEITAAVQADPDAVPLDVDWSERFW
jgi:hypothetical protein